MIGAFCAHARKEIREQRSLLLSGGVVVLLAVPATAALTGYPGWTAHTSRLTLSFMGAMMFLATIAGDLLSGDRIRNTRGFLARTPRGLRFSFGVKLAFLVIAAPLLPIMGWWLGSWSIAEDLASAKNDSAIVALFALAPLWVFACGAFVNRPVLALPLGLAVLVPWLLLLNTAMARMAGTPFGYWLSTTVGSRLAIGFGVLTVAVLAASRRAFTLRRRAALTPLATGVFLASLPLVHLWYLATEPSAHELRLHPYFQSPDSNAGIFGAESVQSPNALSWTVKIDQDSGALTVPDDDALARELSHPRRVASRFSLPSGDVVEHSLEEIRIRRGDREVFHHRIEGRIASRCGLGFELRRVASKIDENRRTGIIDLVRGLFVEASTTTPKYVTITVEGWVVADRTRTRPYRAENWRLVDPMTRVERPLDALRAGDDVVNVLLDGRLLVTLRSADAKQDDRAAVVDLRDGTRKDLDLDPRLPAAALQWYRAMRERTDSPDRDRDWFQGRDDSLFYLAPGSDRFTHFADDVRVVAPGNPRELLVLRRSGRQLCALPIDGGPPRVIFPR
ncbi:MAG: hypothetical protein AB7I19_11105 [Planctomycetota bacterium]